MPSWTIIEIDENGSRFLERREITAACAPGGHDDTMLNRKGKRILQPNIKNAI
jgi:hypothetical protein